MLDIKSLHGGYCYLTFVKVNFQNILSGTLSTYQMVLIQIRSDFVGLDLDPNCLQGYQQMTKVGLP